MSQSTYPMTPRTSGSSSGPIVVELGTRQLPPRMRLGGLRRSMGLRAPHITTGLRRVLMVPVALMTRLLDR